MLAFIFAVRAYQSINIAYQHISLRPTDRSGSILCPNLGLILVLSRLQDSKSAPDDLPHRIIYAHRSYIFFITYQAALVQGLQVTITKSVHKEVPLFGKFCLPKMLLMLFPDFPTKDILFLPWLLFFLFSVLFIVCSLKPYILVVNAKETFFHAMDFFDVYFFPIC